MNLEEFRTKLFGMSGLATVEKAFELYSELEAENERLKGAIKVMHTECDTCWKIEELRKENAKLKCLAMHLFERVAFNQASEWADICDVEYNDTKRQKYKRYEKRWFRIYERCGESYRKAKESLKAGK